MKRKIILTILAIGGLISNLKAQYAADALRFSQVQPGSNARFKAIGNAHTAIGGDLSSISGNPAGIGLITRSEWSATLEFNNYTSKSAYLNTNTLGSKDMLNIHQAAAVFHIPNLKPKGSDLEKGWVSFDFGIGYNRNADFGNNIIFSGTNPNHSIADYFAELATKNYGAPNTLTTGSLERMAYDDYLIGYDAQGDFYFPETDINNIQTKSEERKGGQSQLNLAFAGNFSNKFYLGINFGFANIRYQSNSRFAEAGYNVTEGSNYQTAFLQNQQTNGKGFNAAIGFIYKPIPSLRLGVNLQTPTWYEIEDNYSEVLNTTHVKPGLENLNSLETYSFIYHLRTPLKLSLGTGIFLGKMGFISADVDMVDYSTMNFRNFNSVDLNIIMKNNQDVMTLYKKAYNYRIGAEIKLKSLMLRGGYGIQGNPYKNLADADFQTKTYSAGIGYRIKRYYMDLSYQQVNFNSKLKPYTLADQTEPVADVNTKRNNIFMTFGLRF